MDSALLVTWIDDEAFERIFGPIPAVVVVASTGVGLEVTRKRPIGAVSAVEVCKETTDVVINHGEQLRVGVLAPPWVPVPPTAPGCSWVSSTPRCRW